MTGQFLQSKSEKVCCLVLIVPRFKSFGRPVGAGYCFTSIRNCILLLKVLIGITFQSPAQNRQNNFCSRSPLAHLLSDQQHPLFARTHPH